LSLSPSSKAVSFVGVLLWDLLLVQTLLSRNSAVFDWCHCCNGSFLVFGLWFFLTDEELMLFLLLHLMLLQLCLSQLSLVLSSLLWLA